MVDNIVQRFVRLQRDRCRFVGVNGQTDLQFVRLQIGLHDDVLHRVRGAIVHANVTGERFAQIDVAETLRQQHKLSGGKRFGAAHGGHVLLEQLREESVGQVFRFGCDDLRIDERRSR